MSLFGQSGALGSTSKSSPFGSINLNLNTTGTQQGSGTGGGLFGSTQNNTGSGLFGSNATTSQPQQTGGLLGSTQTQPKQTSIFGSFAPQQQQQQPQQQQTGGGLFGASTTQQKPAGSLFAGLGGGQQQQQQQQPQQTNLFGGLGASTQQTQQPQQQQSSIFGGSILGGQQQQTQQQPQLGQSTMQQQNLGTSLWSPGRAITGVHRTVPMQMAIVKDKWDHSTLSSPFRAYLYNNVGEDSAPFYQPGPHEDATKWEEALRKRPSSGSVPVLVRGFWELGKRAQRQKDFLAMMQSRLHEINNCLTELLSRHDLKISVRIADARRKHLVLSKRCLALAAKTQVLRNRGYAMDAAEEELKKKLAKLERDVFDPSINGRGEEIWARMLAIRELSKRLQLEVEKAGPSAAQQAESEIDEDAMKTAKKILDGYHAQIQYLQKELESVKKDLEEALKSHGPVAA